MIFDDEKVPSADDNSGAGVAPAEGGGDAPAG